MIYLFSSQPETIKTFFLDHNIEYTLIPADALKDFASNYTQKNEDWGLVYDFGKFIPASLLEKLFLVNIHFSLLPKYRGATPVEAAILAGETGTGISIQKMVQKMDEGDLLMTKHVSIDPQWSAGELQSYMDSLLPEMLEDLVSIHPCERKLSVQVGEPSYCYEALLNREKGQIKYAELSARDVVNRVRAFNPEPIAWMHAQKNGESTTINIYRAEITDAPISPGTFQFMKKRGLLLGCSDGAVLITDLIVAGSKRLTNGDIVSLKGSVTLQP